MNIVDIYRPVQRLRNRSWFFLAISEWNSYFWFTVYAGFNTFWRTDKCLASEPWIFDYK